MRRPLALAALALLLAPVGAQDDQAPAAHAHVHAAPVDAERALELAREALAAVQAAFPDEPFAEHVEVAVVDRETLAEVLRGELLPQFVAQFGEGEFAEAQCDAQVDVLSYALLARYAWSRNAIHVCLENVEPLADMLGRPELAQDGAVRALLVHEAVHARDQAKYGFAESFGSVGSTDAVQGLNAVVEGHAQHVARRVCAARDWTPGFRTFTESIAAVPDDVGEGVEGMMLRVQAAMFSFAYYDGEAFVAAVEAEGGAEALARAFAEPPDGPTVVANPAWFLDPSLRPVSAVDVDRGLDAFDARLAPEGRAAQRVALTMAQLRPILAGLPEADVARFERGLREMKVGVLSDPETPDEQATAGIYEFGSAGEALFGLALMQSLMHLRDAQNKEGPVRITRAEYTDLDPGGGVRGLLADKRVETPFGESIVLVALVARGPALVELMVVGAPPPGDELAAHAVAVLDAALAPPDSAGDGGADGGTEGDAEDPPPPPPEEGGDGALSGSRSAPGGTR